MGQKYLALLERWLDPCITAMWIVVCLALLYRFMTKNTITCIKVSSTYTLRLPQTTQYMYLHVWLALGTVRFCFVNAAGQCIFFYTLLYMNNGEAVEILGLSIVKSVVEARVVCQLSALLSKQHYHQAKEQGLTKERKTAASTRKHSIEHFHRDVLLVPIKRIATVSVV